MIQGTDITPEYLINLMTLNDSHVSPKAYWSILNMFLNNKQDSSSAVSLCDWISE